MTSLVSLTYEGWPVGRQRSGAKEEQGWGRMREGRRCLETGRRMMA